jgi:hypothetical protein
MMHKYLSQYQMTLYCNTGIQRVKKLKLLQILVLFVTALFPHENLDFPQYLNLCPSPPPKKSAIRSMPISARVRQGEV